MKKRRATSSPLEFAIDCLFFAPPCLALPSPGLASASVQTATLGNTKCQMSVNLTSPSYCTLHTLFNKCPGLVVHVIAHLAPDTATPASRVTGEHSGKAYLYWYALRHPGIGIGTSQAGRLSPPAARAVCSGPLPSVGYLPHPVRQNPSFEKDQSVLPGVCSMSHQHQISPCYQQRLAY